ncbi:MAG: hypothetical protein EB120_10925 [Proteobacteria bacterium]|nr:hypothetical protein [Pseudomonadota bacterium]
MNSKECVDCGTKDEFCCSNSRAKHQILLDELASKNRQLEELRLENEKLSLAVQEKHQINKELMSKLDKAEQNLVVWKKHSAQWQKHYNELNEGWKSSYDGLVSELNFLYQRMKKLGN